MFSFTNDTLFSYMKLLGNEMIQFMDWSIYSFDNIVMLAPLSRKLDVKYVGLIKVNVTRM